MSSSAAELSTRRRAARVTVAVAAGVALAAVLVALGRYEDRRNVETQVRGMAGIRALVGPLDSPTLSGYRVQPLFDCLVYRRGTNPWALELCVDRAGRVVEAIDRRRTERRIYSLRYEEQASTLRVDRREVDRLLRKMGAG